LKRDFSPLLRELEWPARLVQITGPQSPKSNYLIFEVDLF